MISQLAEQEGVTEDKIMLSLSDINILGYDTPISVQLNVADIIGEYAVKFTRRVFFLLLFTAESRFLKPPRETKIGARNQEFEKLKVASNDAKLLRYRFIRGSHAHFRSNRWEMAYLSPAV